MKTLSRSAWIAIAACLAVPATVAIAKSYDHGGWSRMTPETKMRLEDGRMAMAKAALKLTPDQEKLWTPIEAQVRAAFKERSDKHAEMQKQREQRRAERQTESKDGKKADAPAADRNRQDLAERFEKMSNDLSKKAERMKSFSGAFKPFYASLSDEQKDVLRPLIHDLAPGLGGGRGHGSRWADGGWGGPKGRGHGGWGGPRHDDRGDRGGPQTEDKADAGPDAGGAPEAGKAE